VKVTAPTSLCLLAAGVLSYVTCYAIGHLAPTGLSDALSIPGALVGKLGGVAGLYDIPSGVWAKVFIAGNFVTYGVVWWIVARLLVRLWGRRHAL